MFAKRIFYVSASLFLPATAYHLGASTATAQAPSNPVVGIAYYNNTVFVATANGDVFGNSGGAWSRWGGNVFGSPTSAQSESFGSLKARYR